MILPILVSTVSDIMEAESVCGDSETKTTLHNKFYSDWCRSTSVSMSIQFSIDELSPTYVENVLNIIQLPIRITMLLIPKSLLLNLAFVPVWLDAVN